MHRPLVWSELLVMTVTQLGLLTTRVSGGVRAAAFVAATESKATKKRMIFFIIFIVLVF
jgi:hypothetical protein